jgi:hypothetical protein
VVRIRGVLLQRNIQGKSTSVTTTVIHHWVAFNYHWRGERGALGPSTLHVKICCGPVFGRNLHVCFFTCIFFFWAEFTRARFADHEQIEIPYRCVRFRYLCMRFENVLRRTRQLPTYGTTRTRCCNNTRLLCCTRTCISFIIPRCWWLKRKKKKIPDHAPRRKAYTEHQPDERGWTALRTERARVRKMSKVLFVARPHSVVYYMVMNWRRARTISRFLPAAHQCVHCRLLARVRWGRKKKLTQYVDRFTAQEYNTMYFVRVCGCAPVVCVHCYGFSGPGKP